MYGFDHSQVTCEHHDAVFSGTQHSLLSVLVQTRAVGAMPVTKMQSRPRPIDIDQWSDEQWTKLGVVLSDNMQSDRELCTMLTSLEGPTAANLPGDVAKRTIDRAEQRFRHLIMQSLRHETKFSSGRPHIPHDRVLLMRKCTTLGQLKAVLTRSRSGGGAAAADVQGKIERLLTILARHSDRWQGVSSQNPDLHALVTASLRDVKHKIRQFDAARRKLHRVHSINEDATKTVKNVMNSELVPPLLSIFDVEQDRLITQPPACKEMLAGYFEKLFDSNDKVPNLAQIDGRDMRAKERSMYRRVQVPKGCYDRLMNVCTVAEVVEHAFPTELVAAGPDLISGGVLGRLVRCSDRVAGAVTTLYNASMQHRYMPKSARHSEIVPLIKSSKKMPTLDNLRPISLQSALFKGLQRIIARRLGDIFVTHNILHEAQEGFLPGRSTHRAVEMVLSVWDQARKNNQSCYNIFYDVSKAYDSIEHRDLLRALHRLGLPASFVEYVASTLSGLTSCVRTVYGVSRNFNVKRGIRQGDPLAPLLFLCVMDVLHTALHQADGGRAGYPYLLKHGRSRRLVRVASGGYADDTWIVSNSRHNMCKLHQILLVFARLHNLVINAIKSVAVGVVCRTRKLDLHVDYGEAGRPPPAHITTVKVHKVEWGQTRCLVNGTELIAQHHHIDIKHLGVPINMGMRTQSVNSKIIGLVAFHQSIARSNRLSFTLASVQQQQWTVNTIEHSVRYAGDVKVAQQKQTRVLRDAGRVRSAHPVQAALHVLSGVHRVETRKIGANLSDFVKIANGSDRLSLVVRQSWRDQHMSSCPATTCIGPTPQLQVCRGMGTLSARALAGASKVKWNIKTKHTVFTELTACAGAGAGNEEGSADGGVDGEGAVATHTHHTRFQNVDLNPMRGLQAGGLRVIAGRPTVSTHCTHRTVVLGGHQHILVFGGFTGVYTVEESNPTTDTNPLVLFTDGGWVDPAHSDRHVEPQKPVAAYGVCVMDDKFRSAQDHIIGEQEGWSTKQRCNQADALGVTRHGGPISGHHGARAYAAELMGILVGLTAAPVDWSLEVRSDCEAGIKAIKQGATVCPARGRMRQQCYAILDAIWWVINTKAQYNARVQLTKVKGHDAGASADAVGNRLADLTVNTVIEQQTMTYDSIHQHESDQRASTTDRHVLWWVDAQWGAAAHPYVFLQHAVHRHVIIDPVRSELRRLDQSKLLQQWMNTRHQSDFLVPSLIRQMKHQLLEFRHNPMISSFILLGYTNSLQWGSVSIVPNELNDRPDQYSRVDDDEPPHHGQNWCNTCDECFNVMHLFVGCKSVDQIACRRTMMSSIASQLQVSLCDLSEDTNLISDVQQLLNLPMLNQTDPANVLRLFGIFTEADEIALKASFGNDDGKIRNCKKVSSMITEQSFHLYLNSLKICCQPLLPSGSVQNTNMENEDTSS
jgi:hypothetical protein